MNHRAKIEELCRKRGWSVSELARRSGLPQSSTDNLIKHRTKAIGAAFRIAATLEVPVEWLFDDSKGLPAPPLRECPPFPITPWPPHGINWQEVQMAIHYYVQERTRMALAAMNKQLEPKGIELVQGPLVPIFPEEEEFGRVLDEALPPKNPRASVRESPGEQKKGRGRRKSE